VVFVDRLRRAAFGPPAQPVEADVATDRQQPGVSAAASAASAKPAPRLQEGLLHGVLGLVVIFEIEAGHLPHVPVMAAVEEREGFRAAGGARLDEPVVSHAQVAPHV
jgi:hypothetical protein